MPREPVADLRAFAFELAGMAKSGLEFVTNDYDRDRFERTLRIAESLAAMTFPGGIPQSSQYLSDLGIVTPKTACSLAAFDETGRLLLIRRPARSNEGRPGRAVRRQPRRLRPAIPRRRVRRRARRHGGAPPARCRGLHRRAEPGSATSCARGGAAFALVPHGLRRGRASRRSRAIRPGRSRAYEQHRFV